MDWRVLLGLDGEGGFQDLLDFFLLGRVKEKKIFHIANIVFFA